MLRACLLLAALPAVDPMPLGWHGCDTTPGGGSFDGTNNKYTLTLARNGVPVTSWAAADRGSSSVVYTLTLAAINPVNVSVRWMGVCCFDGANMSAQAWGLGAG